VISRAKKKFLAHELHEFTRMVFFVFCPQITQILKIGVTVRR